MNVPSGMRDLTDSVKKPSPTPPNGRMHFTISLFMASGPDITAPDWLSMGIETFPRGRDKDNGDDLEASFITNYAASDGGTNTIRQVMTFGRRDFAMSVFVRNEKSAKYAVLYTTVRKEQFLTFEFRGNDRDKLDQISRNTMGTLKFFE